MTHMGPMSESQGKFREPTPVPDRECPKCNQKGGVTCKTWDSSDGAYEDEKFTCTCGHVWWIDGIDS